MQDNIDTDQILPKQFLRTIDRDGLGKALFFDQRFDRDGALIPGFELNLPDRAGAALMIAGDNFGCGSSREHAVWALVDFGIRCIVATSFADIFANNALGNGLLLITLPPIDTAALAAEVGGGDFQVDLPAQTITTPSGRTQPFAIDPGAKTKLIGGLDAIAETLLHSEKITAFENRRGRSLSSFH